MSEILEQCSLESLSQQAIDDLTFHWQNNNAVHVYAVLERITTFIVFTNQQTNGQYQTITDNIISECLMLAAVQMQKELDGNLLSQETREMLQKALVGIHKELSYYDSISRPKKPREINLILPTKMKVH